jgi:Zn-dependent peptidase ImmA (M78 family)
MNKRSLQWSRSPFTVRTVEAMPSCVTGMPPTGNRSIAVMRAGVAAARILLPMPRLQARREEILHAYQERSSLRGLTRTFGVSRATVSSWIKKK